MYNYNIKDYRTQMWEGFKQYYVYYAYCGGCDPAYDVMNYICEKDKLSMSDRYYLALLYGCTYSDSTAYTIFKRIPIHKSKSEMTDLWFKHKPNLQFTSDRKKVKNFDELPNIIESYKSLIGEQSQEKFFKQFVDMDVTPEERYKKVYEVSDKIHYFGRFSLFNYLESLNELTPVYVYPDTLELRHAESARNALCYACGLPDQVTLHHKKSKQPIDYPLLEQKLVQLEQELQDENPEINVTLFNIETALCGYKKLFWNTRYLGYYIDRHGAGTLWMEQHNPDISYKHIWDFRDKYLVPLFNHTNIRKERLKFVNKYGTLIDPNTTLFGEVEQMPKFTIDNLVPHLRRNDK